MHIKPSLIVAAIISATITGPTLAEISGNIAVTSNYIWRGVTQTNDDSAVSGGIDYSHDKGFYAGTWTSNVSGGHEIDFYLGYGGKSGGVEYDAGYAYYAYPGNSNTDGDFGEVNANASFGMLKAGLAYTVNSGDDNNNNAFDTGDLYLHAGVGGNLEQAWSWAITLGMYEFDADGETGVGDISYMHYQVDLGKSAGDFGDFVFTLSGAERESGSNDPKAVATWSKSF